jgi:phosphoglycolate phosphatase-like HAD superfamily hydrolase
MNVRAVIFDYDGTLVDLRATAEQMDTLRNAVRECFGEFGAQLPFRPFYHDIDAALELVQKRRPDAAPAIRSQVGEVILRYEEQFSAASAAKPAASDAWQAARQNAIVGIVSNNMAPWIRPTLERHGIAGPGDAYEIVGFEECERHKPHADGLSRVVERLGLVSGDHAVYVGDHYDDLEACRRYNALGGVQLTPIIVQGGKCDWARVAAHPNFCEQRAIRDLSAFATLLVCLEDVDVTIH